MPTEPNTPQSVIPFKLPHLTPVLDRPSPVVPESAAFLSLQQHLTEKANLEFVPVKARSLEQRARLVYVSAQCEELETQVTKERLEAQIASLKRQIQGLKAMLRQTAPKWRRRMDDAIRKQRKVARAAIEKMKAELIPLEAAKAEMSQVSSSVQLHPYTRNQFLKMVGMTALAAALWNRAAAMEYGETVAGSSWCSFGSTSAWFSSCSQATPDEREFVGTLENNYMEGYFPSDEYPKVDRPDVFHILAAIKAAIKIWEKVSDVIDLLKPVFTRIGRGDADHEYFQKMIIAAGGSSGAISTTAAGLTVTQGGATIYAPTDPISVMVFWGYGNVNILAELEITGKDGDKITIYPNVASWSWSPPSP